MSTSTRFMGMPTPSLYRNVWKTIYAILSMNVSFNSTAHLAADEVKAAEKRAS
jgi:hypothetical protein